MNKTEIALIQKRITIFKTKEARLIKLKKALRGDLPNVRKTINRLNNWINESK